MAEQMQNPMVTVDLPVEGQHAPGAWKARITSAKQRMEPIIKRGQENVRRYQVQHLDYDPKADTVVVPKDFANVEQKKPQLFFQSPEIQLRPTLPGLEAAALKFQAVVNEKLGPDGADAKSMVGEVLFDVLCPTGFGVSKIGFEAVTEPVPIPEHATDPRIAPLGLQAAMVQAPRTIYQRYFWDRCSPGKFLYPDDFTGSNFDQAAWLGVEFSIDAEKGRAQWNLGEDGGKASGDGEDQRLLSPRDNQTGDKSRTPKLTCYEIWYKAALFDVNEKHPEKLRQLIFVEGVDDPVVHRDSPYQRVNNAGQLIGMMGFPLHVLTLRYVSDQAIPPSDCSISRVLTDELSRGRTQMLQQRSRSKPLRWFDTNQVGKETVDKIVSGEMQELIPVPGDGSLMFGEISKASYSRENFTFNDYVNEDISEAWAMGNNQRGAENDASTTATEASIMQGNSDVRLDAERTRVLEWYCKGAEKFAALIQLFADETEYVSVLGAQGAKTLEAWDKTQIAGKFVFSAKPDSAIRVDAASERRQTLDLYKFTVNDPNVNRTELLKAIFQKYGYDPERLVAAQLPEKGPEPPKITLSVSGIDLNPAAPQYQAVIALLAANGIQIDPAATMAQGQPGGQPAHGGPAQVEAGMGASTAQRSGMLPGNAEAQARGLVQ